MSTESLQVDLAYLAWFPLTLLFFRLLPRTSAICVAIIGGWLFLPSAELSIAGLPDVNKWVIVSSALLLGVVLFELPRVLSFRPRWFDLPTLVLFCCPFPTSVLNDLGAYDGVSNMFQSAIQWGIPYFVGRIFFQTPAALDQLFKSLIIGGLVYAPLCFHEARFSPQLQWQIYGVYHTFWLGLVRYGGFRPLLFQENSLIVAFWMALTTMFALSWLLREPARKILYMPPWIFVSVLLAAVAICKTLGAFLILVVGSSVILLARVGPARSLLLLLTLIPPGYVIARTTGLLDMRQYHSDIAKWSDQERAESFDFRIKNEDSLIANANQRPFFGWGGYGRSYVRDERNKAVGILDGLWIILYGNLGGIALAALMGTLLIPVWRFLLLLPGRLWSAPSNAQAAAIAVALTLFMIDNLMNSARCLPLILAGGALNSFCEWKIRDRHLAAAVRKTARREAVAAARSETTGRNPVARRG